MTNIKTIMDLAIQENNYEIPLVITEFHYSKHLQEETGIVGYKKTEIDIKDLEVILKDYDTGKIHLKSKKEMEDERRFHESIPYGLAYLNPCEDLTRRILKVLTKGEFPFRTFNHDFGAYTEHKDLMFTEFLSSNLFLQKNYDLDLIKNKKWNFGNKTITSDYSFDGGWSIVDPTTYKVVRTVARLSDLDIEEIKEGKFFTFKPEHGLNVFPRSVWNRGDQHSYYGNIFEDKKLVIGYASTDLFDEISERSKNIIKKVIDANPGYKTKSLTNKLFEIDFINKGNSILYDYLMEDDKPAYMDYCLDAENNKMVLNVFTHGLHHANNEPIKINTNIPDDAFLFDREARSQSLVVPDNKTTYPIFVGSKEIPQLMWGHAKYACLTVNGKASLYEFIHNDKLPKKYQNK